MITTDFSDYSSGSNDMDLNLDLNNDKEEKNSGDIDLMKDYTSNNDYNFNSGSNNKESSSESNNKTSTSDSWKDKDSVFTRNSNSGSNNSGSNNLDLSDQTGNNYFNKNKSSGSDKKDNELDLMKDYTGNNYDPSNNADKQRNNLLDIIDKKYPGSKKNDFNNVDFNSKTATEEEFAEETGYKFGDIDFLEKAKTDYIGMGLPEQTLQENIRQSKEYQQSQRNNYLKQGLFSGLKNAAVSGNPMSIVSGGINGFFNMLSGPQYSEEYMQNKDRPQDMYGTTIEEYADMPSPGDYNLEKDSSGDTSRDSSGGSDRWGGTVFNDDQNQTNTDNGQTDEGEETDQGGENWGDLLTWFMLNDQQDQQSGSGGQQSGSGGGTTNIITAGGEEKQENNQLEGLKQYLPIGMFAAVIGLLFVLGGE
jgi:hypothetical protein